MLCYAEGLYTVYIMYYIYYDKKAHYGFFKCLDLTQKLPTQKVLFSIWGSQIKPSVDFETCFSPGMLQSTAGTPRPFPPKYKKQRNDLWALRTSYRWTHTVWYLGGHQEVWSFHFQAYIIILGLKILNQRTTILWNSFSYYLISLFL